jgi:ubiquinone biosynthesis protein UbiJ
MEDIKILKQQVEALQRQIAELVAGMGKGTIPASVAQCCDRFKTDAVEKVLEDLTEELNNLKSES